MTLNDDTIERIALRLVEASAFDGYHDFKSGVLSAVRIIAEFDGVTADRVERLAENIRANEVSERDQIPSGFDIFSAVVDARREEVRTYEAWLSTRLDPDASEDERDQAAEAYRDASQARVNLTQAFREDARIPHGVADLAIRAAQSMH